jgi:predicted PurR-regulated permease PerM
MLLGVKAAFALGFIAGLMEFIPTVGPILSAVPAILMGFVDSPEKALAVGLAYWGIQFVENNLLIPYLMRGEMDLPPAITIIAQTLMTLVFGFLGLMVAVPLTAAVLVPLRMMAERENAREKELVRFHKSQRDLMHADVKPEDVMEVANTGPEIPSGSSSGGATP